MKLGMKALVAAVALSCASQSSAQECITTREKLGAVLPGTWVAENGFGTLSFAGKTMVLPPRNGGVGEITATETGLAALDWGVPGTFPITFVEDARFVLSAPDRSVNNEGELFLGPLPEFVTDAEIALLIGCSGDQIPPQLSISGSFQDAEGTVDFEVYLFVVGVDLLYGVTSGELSAMNGKARRITRWVRAN